MITVEQALADVLAAASPLPAETRKAEEALGSVLAEDVEAKGDSPPFDKSLMDGFAIRSCDFQGAKPASSAHVVERVTAGRMPAHTIAQGEAALVMTGAPIPRGADCVVQREHAETIDADRVAFTRLELIRPGLSIFPKGGEIRSGERVLEAGMALSPIRLAAAAAAGATDFRVIPRPRVAILATGDELVPPHLTPGPGQIRESNSTMLKGLLALAGARSIDQGIAPDDPGELKSRIAAALEAADILLATGGVSAGDLDLVPAMLAELGVERVFHKVRLKPGKPVWFGVAKGGGGRRRLVFGLPGNPVSVLVTYLLFVRPAIEILAGRGSIAQEPLCLNLVSGYEHRGDRPTYHPARRVGADEAEPLSWRGSADLRAIARADGFAIFPAGDRKYEQGSAVAFLPFERAISG